MRPSSGSARVPAAALLAACALVAGPACDHGPVAAPPSTYPPGTVLALNGLPIRAQDVDVYAEAYARLEPGFVEAHCRRLALTNVIFPRLAAVGIDPKAREAAHKRALEYKAALDGGASASSPLVGPAEVRRQGNWKTIGLDAWIATVDRQNGAWSDVFETPGAFELVRLVERGKQAVAQEVQLDVAVVDFPYLDGDVFHTIDAALDAARLEIVDPAWRDYVPTLWQHRLHAQSP